MIQEQIDRELIKANQMAIDFQKAKKTQKKKNLPKGFQGSFIKQQTRAPKEEASPPKRNQLGAGGYTEVQDGKKFQGVDNLHHWKGIHQMAKDDRTFAEKRWDRLNDVFEKDKMLKDMKADGYTNFKPDKDNHFN